MSSVLKGLIERRYVVVDLPDVPPSWKRTGSFIVTKSAKRLLVLVILTDVNCRDSVEFNPVREDEFQRSHGASGTIRVLVTGPPWVIDWTDVESAS